MAEGRSEQHGLEETGAPVDGGLVGAGGKAGDPEHETDDGPTTGADSDEMSAGSTSPLDLVRGVLGTRDDEKRD